jgi:hypothetical protein
MLNKTAIFPLIFSHTKLSVFLHSGKTFFDYVPDI